MDLGQLFPNSPKNAFERILNDKHNEADVKIVRDALEREAFERSPITISTEELKESGKPREWATNISRNGNRIEFFRSHIKGRAEYNTAKMKHLLLGHDKPDLRDFEIDPNTNDCVACGAPDSPRDLGSGGPYRCKNCVVY